MSPPETQKAPAGAAPAPGEKNAYRATLNLPRTAFPMKASLVQNEPASMKRWDGARLYDAVRQARRGRDRFVFHDGPPYANGSIHLGHLLNKCLKDFVVRSRSMMGLDCPFVPGWDCHGLPIEHKVVSELMESGKFEKLKGLSEEHRRLAVRRECQRYAEKYVKLQAGQMQRLLTLADYADPYLTMSPAYEAATLEVLAALLEQGLVYRALKPVHWSIANETALADAELEYYDREDPSIYVDFEAADAGAVYDAFALPAHGPDDDEETGPRPTQSPTFMIWTTTPWTLPANLAIAVNPRFTYALVRIDGNVTVLAADAVERVTRTAGAEDVAVLATATGDKLAGLRYRHPFVDPARGEGPAGDAAPLYRLVPADYVTLEDGTGLVHTAPGHGEEDYLTGGREGLPIYCPVRADGTYDQTVPAWIRGQSIWKANEAILAHLRESGHLFHHHRFTHSYPHDWRGKTPVIFRCTEQWFVSVDGPTRRDGQSLRALGLRAVDPRAGQDSVGFVPEWGRNRMRGMLESRPDWCISRQRAWGLPIPAFFASAPGGQETWLMTAASVRAVAKVVREKGSDAWFTASPADLLRHYDLGADPDAPAPLKAMKPAEGLAALRKGQDILDVWFESGSSWNACMRERSGGTDFPVELYLEGSDQHRGWFQTSLLPALGMTGRPPYRAILTHGFMVDKDGRKMSKSLGNTIEVDDLLKEHGADVCRWWIASLSYEHDIKVDRAFFEVAGESYRKMRNTLRFMLGNLDDFAPPASGPASVDVPPASLEAWVLAEYDAVAADVVSAFERYAFQEAHRRLYDFCNDTLSATYLAAIKDRLYCDKPGAPRRRRTQAALWDLADGLCRLLAPILCHTADEAFRALWKAAPDDAGRCVHLAEFVRRIGAPAEPGWETVFAAREAALQAIEKVRAGAGVENPLDMGVTLPDPQGVLARFDRGDLADLLGVSRVTLDPRGAAPVVADLRGEPRCDRSWKRDGTVRARSDGGMLSDRDADAVGVA